MGVWDGLDESEISRPEILFQSAPGSTQGVLEMPLDINTNLGLYEMVTL